MSDHFLGYQIEYTVGRASEHSLRLARFATAKARVRRGSVAIDSVYSSVVVPKDETFEALGTREGNEQRVHVARRVRTGQEDVGIFCSFNGKFDNFLSRALITTLKRNFS